MAGRGVLNVFALAGELSFLVPLDVRTAGALTLLFGLQHTRLLELTVPDIIDDDMVVALNLNGLRLPLPPEAPSWSAHCATSARNAGTSTRRAGTTP
ncbi:hypothetical protein P9869_22155 [Streptomyces ossamyceticus]|nr:hypothetical protein [Streptomyces ossamyceticus]